MGTADRDNPPHTGCHVCWAWKRPIASQTPHDLNGWSDCDCQYSSHCFGANWHRQAATTLAFHAFNNESTPSWTPPGVFLGTDLYACCCWRWAQYLTDQFWLRWRQEYLQNTQPRRKWSSSRQNLTNGDVVLMKEEGAYRNDWPMGKVMEAIQSKDGQVRKK